MVGAALARAADKVEQVIAQAQDYARRFL